MSDRPSQPSTSQQGRLDILIISRYCAGINNNLPQLKSLLFENVCLDANSWQHKSSANSSKLARQRWNVTKTIEQYLIELVPDPWKYRNETCSISHAVEHFLFKTAPSHAVYSQHHLLQRRSMTMVHYIAKKILCGRSKAFTTKKLNSPDNKELNHALAA